MELQQSLHYLRCGYEWRKWAGLQRLAQVATGRGTRKRRLPVRHSEAVRPATRPPRPSSYALRQLANHPHLESRLPRRWCMRLEGEMAFDGIRNGVHHAFAANIARKVVDVKDPVVSCGLLTHQIVSK
jgi:hypothetical protein